MIRDISNIFSGALFLYMSLRKLNKDDIVKARIHLDRALSRAAGEFIFIAAYDARLMTFERRPLQAYQRYQEVFETIPRDGVKENVYVSLYAQFFIQVYEGRKGLQVIKDAAEDLGVSMAIKQFIPFPSDQKIMRAENKIKP